MILLDTHIWVNWILSGDDALTPAVVQAMQEESRLPSLVLKYHYW